VTVTRTSSVDPSLPQDLRWHSAAMFRSRPDWHVVYARTNEPVVMEKAVGKGTIVALTDGFLLSNEALRNDPQMTFLRWLIGPGKAVVFEETHLGIEEQPGLVSLARRYRLHGLGLALILVAALYVWRSASSLTPRAAHADARDAEMRVAGDAASGLARLLARTIAPTDLVRACLDAWRQSHPHPPDWLAPRVAAMQDAVNAEAGKPAREQNPVDLYRRLVRLRHSDPP
jgi:hypothetical protein